MVLVNHPLSQNLLYINVVKTKLNEAIIVIISKGRKTNKSSLNVLICGYNFQFKFF